MPTRSHRLWGPTSLTGTAATLVYTSPPGVTTLLKYLTVANLSGATIFWNLRTGTGGATQVAGGSILTGQYSREIMGFVVPAGGTLYVAQGVGGALQYVTSGSGFEFDA